jgi:glycosyltransferase involved in cell wall biosynthesis
VLFLVPRIDKASTRYRVLQYLPYLDQAGIRYEIEILFSGGWRNILALTPKLRSANCVFIQKKLFSSFELFWVRLFSQRIVFDFDDAIIHKDSPASVLQQSRQKRRFAATVRKADLIIVGNGYLRDVTSSYNENLTLIPTVLDMDRYTRKKLDEKEDKDIVLGWIGSRGTLKYLQYISPALEEIGRKWPGVKLKIVADDFFSLTDMAVIRKNWSSRDEIADLHSFDIGLMPLVDDLWTRGKCGFKLLQCMAVGMPVVCSPVGVNTEIVSDGIEGFWASTQEEWVDRLTKLIEDRTLRKEMGRKGREKVEKYFSLEANVPLFIRSLQDGD